MPDVVSYRTDLIGGGRAFLKSTLRRDSARADDAVRAACETILSGELPRDFASLTGRELFPLAARYLASLAGAGAAAVGVLFADGGHAARVAECFRDEHCARAAIGIIEWPTASRDARAAYALRRLVITFRDRPVKG